MRSLIIVTSFTTVFTLTACASLSPRTTGKASSTAANKAGSPATNTASSKAPASCNALILAWEKDHGHADQTALANAITTVTKDQAKVISALTDGTNSDTSKFASDLGSLEGITYRIRLKDAPPSCSARFHEDYLAAVADYGMSAIYETELAGAVNKDNLIQADADITLANQEMKTANEKTGAASNDLNNLSGS